MWIPSRRWVLLSLCCFSCGQPSKQPPTPLEQLPGGFKFVESVVVAGSEVPEQIRVAGLQSTQRWIYRGPSLLSVTVYEMTTGPAAFELVQQWRPSPGLIYFHSGSRFVMVEAKELGQPELNEVAKAIESHLGRV